MIYHRIPLPDLIRAGIVDGAQGGFVRDPKRCMLFERDEHEEFIPLEALSGGSIDCSGVHNPTITINISIDDQYQIDSDKLREAIVRIMRDAKLRESNIGISCPGCVASNDKENY